MTGKALSLKASLVVMATIRCLNSGHLINDNELPDLVRRVNRARVGCIGDNSGSVSG